MLRFYVKTIKIDAFMHLQCILIICGLEYESSVEQIKWLLSHLRLVIDSVCGVFSSFFPHSHSKQLTVCNIKIRHFTIIQVSIIVLSVEIVTY